MLYQFTIAIYMLMSLVNSLIHSRRQCFGLIATDALARCCGQVVKWMITASRLSASHYATGIAHASVHLHYVLAVQITAVLYSRSSQTDILKITKLVIDYCFIIINPLYNYIWWSIIDICFQEQFHNVIDAFIQNVEQT